LDRFFCLKLGHGTEGEENPEPRGTPYLGESGGKPDALQHGALLTEKGSQEGAWRGGHQGSYSKNHGCLSYNRRLLGSMAAQKLIEERDF